MAAPAPGDWHGMTRLTFRGSGPGAALVPLPGRQFALAGHG